MLVATYSDGNPLGVETHQTAAPHHRGTVGVAVEEGKVVFLEGLDVHGYPMVHLRSAHKGHQSNAVPADGTALTNVLSRQQPADRR